MIERLAKQCVVLLLLVMVAPAALKLFGGILAEVTSDLSIERPAGAGGITITYLIFGLFAVGLTARCGRWLRHRDREAARWRDAQERRARVAVRDPAEDVPIHQPHVHVPEDPDPPLDLDG